jgi:hypothetical protein
MKRPTWIAAALFSLCACAPETPQGPPPNAADPNEPSLLEKGNADARDAPAMPPEPTDGMATPP